MGGIYSTYFCHSIRDNLASAAQIQSPLSGLLNLIEKSVVDVIHQLLINHGTGESHQQAKAQNTNC